MNLVNAWTVFVIFIYAGNLVPALGETCNMPALWLALKCLNNNKTSQLMNFVRISYMEASQ